MRYDWEAPTHDTSSIFNTRHTAREHASVFSAQETNMAYVFRRMENRIPVLEIRK